MSLLITPSTVASVSVSSIKTLVPKSALFGRFRSSGIGRKSRFDVLRVATQPSVPEQRTFESDLNGDEVYGTEIEEENGNIDVKFTWRDHWYPVSLIEDLDPLKPTPFQLLGRDLVLWKDRATGEWVALDDKCPHRLAPLSEGRIDEQGNLQCSYHGWSFDRCGSCTRIPQAASEGPEARAVKSPRARATKLPTMVSQGLLFVWPDENGFERAQATQPPRLPDDFDSPEFSTVTIQRDLFYGYDTLMENVSDPSHIDFAHHKVGEYGYSGLETTFNFNKHFQAVYSS